MNLDYKEGRGDYYLAEGLREDSSTKRITKQQLINALRNTGIAPIGMSYEQAANHIWMELK